MVGWPWREGGRSRDGIDCLGVVLFLYKEVYGLELPDAFTQTGTDTQKGLEFYARVAGEVENPAVGDVVFLPTGTVDHLGVYLGGGKYLSASRRSGVTIQRVPIHRVRFFRMRPAAWQT